VAIIATLKNNKLILQQYLPSRLQVFEKPEKV